MHLSSDKSEKKIPLHFLVPAKSIDSIKKIVIILGGVEEDDVDDGDDFVSWTEAFPETQPGEILKGYRLRDGLTQKKLAEKIKGKQGHISQMEKELRAIGVTTAKKLAKAFKTNYKVFL